MEIIELLKKENFVRYLESVSPGCTVGYNNTPICCPIAKYLQNNGFEYARVDYEKSERNTRILRLEEILLDKDNVPEWVKVFVRKVDDELESDVTAGVALEILKGI